MDSSKFIRHLDSIYITLQEMHNKSERNEVYVIIGFIIAILIPLITTSIQYKSIKQTIKANTEITFRQEWIDNLRDTLSLYVNKLFLLMDRENFHDFTLRGEFINNSYKLKLLLNSDRKEDQSLAYRILNNVEFIYRKSILNNHDDILYMVEIREAIDDVVDLVRIILIREWREVQKEEKTSPEFINSENNFIVSMKKIESRLKERMELVKDKKEV